MNFTKEELIAAVKADDVNLLENFGTRENILRNQIIELEKKIPLIKASMGAIGKFFSDNDIGLIYTGIIYGMYIRENQYLSHMVGDLASESKDKG